MPNGCPIVLAQISTNQSSSNDFQYFLWQASDITLSKPWTLLGNIPNLPSPLIDGSIVYDRKTGIFTLSTVPLNPPQYVRFYQSTRLLSGYTQLGTGTDPYGLRAGSGGLDFEGQSLIPMGNGVWRWFGDNRGGGDWTSVNPNGITVAGWSTPRLVTSPFLMQGGRPLVTSILRSTNIKL